MALEASTIATAPPDLHCLLKDLIDSLTTTSTALSGTLLNSATKGVTQDNATVSSSDTDLIIPPRNGISLLDLKNELMLSYLHNIVFLVLLKLRGGTLDGSVIGGKKDEDEESLGSELVRKLVELRIILDKGIKPIESKLKYQIDKVVRVALEEETERKARAEQLKRNRKRKKVRDSNEDDREEDSDDDNHDDDSTSGESSSKASENEESTLSILDMGDDSAEPQKARKNPSLIPSHTTKEELSYRPNPTALTKPTHSSPSISSTKLTGKETNTTKNDGIYRPPKISATVMPDLPLTSQTTDSQSWTNRNSRRPTRNAALNDFIASELSTAPIAEPSIGSAIVAHGRINRTARERAEEVERREYEEANFVRLPKPSKKEMRDRKRHSGGGSERDNFGGEDWRSFAGDLDRLTRGSAANGSRSRGKSALENSRKRKETEVGPIGGSDERSMKIGSKYQRSVKRTKR